MITYSCAYSRDCGILVMMPEFEFAEHMYSTSYLVVPTFDILTCDDVLLPRVGSTGAIKFQFCRHICV